MVYGDFDTVGGYVTNQFGHLPERGEVVTIGHFSFTVIRSDNRRLHLLEMKVLADSDSASDS